MSEAVESHQAQNNIPEITQGFAKTLNLFFLSCPAQLNLYGSYTCCRACGMLLLLQQSCYGIFSMHPTGAAHGG